MLLAYNGAGFRGFAQNPGVRTVAGELTQALQQILKQDITLVCAGRTDAGVHAWGQVVSFEVASSDGGDAVGDTADVAGVAEAGNSETPELNLSKLKASLNQMCGPEISVRQAEAAPPSFDARHSASQRTYRYRILNQLEPDPFRAGLVWHLPGELAVETMHEAAQQIIGEHDFTSFCRRSAPDKSLVRRVIQASWSHQPELHEVVLEITATAFCHQMVRSLVGTMVEVGQGRRPPESLTQALAAKDRHAAGNLAPPQGLCLWEVGYEATSYNAARYAVSHAADEAAADTVSHAVGDSTTDSTGAI